MSLFKQLIVILAIFCVSPVYAFVSAALSKRFTDYKELIWGIGFFVTVVLALLLVYVLRTKTDFGKQIREK